MNSTTEQQGLPDALAIAEAVADRLFTYDATLRIVWTNRAFQLAFGEANVLPVRTLCDVLQCRHAESGPACGTAPACGGCGWFQAAMACQRDGGKARAELHVLSRTGDAFDFGVTTVALRGGGAGTARSHGLPARRAYGDRACR